MGKKIIFTRPDGGLSVCTPSEGARLAFWIEAADGSRILCTGKRVAAAAAGHEEALRLALLERLDGLEVSVDRIMRRWPVPGYTAEWAETEAQWLLRIQAKDVPGDALEARIVDESEMPPDRSFRNAWRMGIGTACVVDMPAARELHRGFLRQLRKPKLEALDVQYMRALEDGANQAAIDAILAKKKGLRNVTDDPAIEAAVTPEELAAVIPPALTQP